MTLITNRLLIGKEISNFSVDVSGGARISSISGQNNLCIVDSSGAINTQSILNFNNNGFGHVGSFGDGSDGDVTISTPMFLIKEMNYNNLTITNGGNLHTMGYIIRVRRTLTINSGGIINCDGFNAIGSSLGLSAYAFPIYPEFGTPSSGGFGGGDGVMDIVTDSGTHAFPGQNGGVFINNMGVTHGPIQFISGCGGGGGGFLGFNDPMFNASPGGNVWAGRFGVGGRGKNAIFASGVQNFCRGGGGGGGAGVLCIYAHTMINSGIIRANGGRGGDGDVSGLDSGGGGGGGGGGLLIINYRELATMGTTQVWGGVAGNGGADTHGSGHNGGNGQIIFSVI